MTKAVLERALTEEMTGHLGYDKHDAAGRASGGCLIARAAGVQSEMELA